MDGVRGLRCSLIGSDSLALECGRILRERGHEIVSVFTDTMRVREWAEQNGLPVFEPYRDFPRRLREEPGDVLFAVTWLEPIAAHLLDLPAHGTINFHDGPLPRHAGLNAPAWALLQGDRGYGITWHRARPQVDTGEVLVERRFDGADDETSLSLNTRCFEAGIDSFRELLSALEEDRLQPRAQSADGRRLHRRRDRPADLAVLDLERPAAELARTVRALHFGDHPNPLGLAKLAHGRSLVVVDEARSTPDQPVSAGQIVGVSRWQLRVGTGAGVLEITRLSTLDGQALDPLEWLAALGLAPGDRLIPWPHHGSDASVRAVRAVGRDEHSRQREAQRFESLPAPFAGSGDDRAQATVQIPSTLVATTPESERARRLAAAAALYLMRLSGAPHGGFGVETSAERPHANTLGSLAAERSPLTLRATASTAGEAWNELDEQLRTEFGRVPMLRELPRRALPKTHALERASIVLAIGEALDAGEERSTVPSHDRSDHTDAVEPDEFHWSFDNTGTRCTLTARLKAETLRRLVAEWLQFVEHLARNPSAKLSSISLIGTTERNVLQEWAGRAIESGAGTILPALQQRMQEDRDRIAATHGSTSWTYRQLEERSAAWARQLRAHGIGREDRVGLHMHRDLEALAALLGVWRAGAAWVPLDPALPRQRLHELVEDAHVRCVLDNTDHSDRFPELAVLRWNEDHGEVNGERSAESHGEPTGESPRPDDAAYVLYTSGSTGKPKGVVLEHGQLASFFAAIAEQVPHETPGTWLAVTRFTFDIALLEWIWPLLHGFHVVIHDPTAAAPNSRSRPRSPTAEPHDSLPHSSCRSGTDFDSHSSALSPSRGISSSHSHSPLDLSLFYFSSEDGTDDSPYRLLLEGARFADREGLCAVWTPERHFHPFGGLYPNPAVTGAAVAAVTEKVEIRAGSVVLPLHHPARVVEEWSVVDRLSSGRIGIALATGWNARDFLLRPQGWADRKEALFRNVELLRRLWRGESVELEGVDGKTETVSTFPRAHQAELPIWITTAGNPETWRLAGEAGAHVLTHLLGQNDSELGEKIALYRRAREKAGFDPHAGRVCLMLHTFLSADGSDVRELVREPLRRYMASSMNLVRKDPWAFPTFRGERSQLDLSELVDEDEDALLEAGFERTYRHTGLFGTVDEALERARRLHELGVDEIACLVDFGVAAERVLESLEPLAELGRRLRAEPTAARSEKRSDDAKVTAEATPTAPSSVAELIRHHGVSHLQCTPSLLRLLLEDSEFRTEIAEVQNLYLGGEALPDDLVRELASLGVRTLTNLYGPTETTIWSTAARVDTRAPSSSIGQPLSNTHVWVVNGRGELLPRGAIGELAIGGTAVARGYQDRDEETRRRFVGDPFSTRAGARMYLTGDRVSWREDGTLQFHGRGDAQIKVRGHRIEPGELESVLRELNDVHAAAAGLHPEVGPDTLCAWIVPTNEGARDPEAIRALLRARLPDALVPGRITFLDRLPLNPSGKLDRRALPAPREAVRAVEAPKDDVERRLAEVWSELLGVGQIGPDEGFFDLGGHSLLVLRLRTRIEEEFGTKLSLPELYQYPTVRRLAERLGSAANEAPVAAKEGAERGAARRARRLGRHRSPQRDGSR